jgi:ABC-type antimicrobial peptide transport system permease subunit
MMVKPALGYSHWISLLLVGILAYFWLNNLVDVTVATRSDGDPFNNVLSNNFEMLQNFFSELHIVIAAIMSFAYVCIFIPICLIYALNKFMREFLKIADNFINIPEVKQVIKMCTM